jgi:NAD(P)-dependent dehydrogenase (short-subunit alcohol dehydrogenase family)
MSNVLVTGTSAGFGFLTVKTLLAAGHVVFATMRDPEGRNADKVAALKDAAASAPGKLHVLDLDVTNEASVNRAIADAIATAGHLDVIVNNAGVGTGGQLEGYTIEQFQQLFDVNVFGVQRVFRAVLPHMRARKQGLIINLSSGLGRYVLPFLSPYIATKFAIEAITDAYALELAPFGIEVVAIQPGAFGTDFMSHALYPADGERIAGYGEFADLPQRMFAGFGEMTAKGLIPDPQLIADKVAELVALPPGSRPARAVVDPLTQDASAPVNEAAAQANRRVLAAFGAG